MAETAAPPAQTPKPSLVGMLLAWAGVVALYLLNPLLWIALALVLVLTSCGVQSWRIQNLKHDVAVKDQQVQTLSHDIQAQNKAVEGLAAAAQAATKADAKRVDAAVLAVQRAGATLSKQVASIKAAKPGPDVCASALDQIHGAGQ
jgi:uncharacterized protein HemX